MAPSMPMVHMVMFACRRFVIPRQSGKVLSRRLDGEVHLKRCLQFQERFAKRVRHVPALPACRRRNRPDDGAVDRSLHAAVTPRYPLLHLLHPEIQFRDVVRGWNRWVSGEREDGIAMAPQALHRNQLAFAGTGHRRRQVRDVPYRCSDTPGERGPGFRLAMGACTAMDNVVYDNQGDGAGRSRA